MKENRDHLPVYGIGPALCYPMAVLSAIGIWMSEKEIIPGKVDNVLVRIIMLVFGILLIIEGIALFFCADLNGNLRENIEQNKLKTNGSYKFVRNPCYCLFLLGSTGAVSASFGITAIVLYMDDSDIEKNRGKVAHRPVRR